MLKSLVLMTLTLFVPQLSRAAVTHIECQSAQSNLSLSISGDFSDLQHSHGGGTFVFAITQGTSERLFRNGYAVATSSSSVEFDEKAPALDAHIIRASLEDATYATNVLSTLSVDSVSTVLRCGFSHPSIGRCEGDCICRHTCH